MIIPEPTQPPVGRRHSAGEIAAGHAARSIGARHAHPAAPIGAPAGPMVNTGPPPVPPVPSSGPSPYCCIDNPIMQDWYSRGPREPAEDMNSIIAEMISRLPPR
jgi:hypothetical protein